MNDIQIHTVAQRRTWNALRVWLKGRSGLIVIPAWSFDTAPWPAGADRTPSAVAHSDGTYFSDGTGYQGSTIRLEMAELAPIGATTVTLKAVDAEADLVGIRFSYNHAFYETGPALDVIGDRWTLPIAPAVRATIPAGAMLQVDLPTCLVHLTTDRAMDIEINSTRLSSHSVGFVEAVDYWSDLAQGVI